SFSRWHGGRDSNSQPTVLETVALPVELPTYAYRVSRCAVCLRHLGQNFDSSIRSGSFFRFFVVAYVRDRQVEHASVMIGRLSLGIAYSRTLVTAPAPTVWPPSRIAKRRPSSRAIGVMRVIVRLDRKSVV